MNTYKFLEYAFGFVAFFMLIFMIVSIIQNNFAAALSALFSSVLSILFAYGNHIDYIKDECKICKK